jgi:hypothetical protein
MFSTASVVATMAAAPATNKITANVRRIVAKVTVETDATVVAEGDAGTRGALTWAINNQNLEYFMMQGAAPLYVDPNWATYDVVDYAPAAATDYVAVNQGPVADVATYNALYAVENTSDKKTMKELTRVTVSSTFIPAQWLTSYTSGSPLAPVPNTNTTPTTFYAVTPAVGQPTQYFANLADASAYSADNGGVPVSAYMDGVCYWNIFLNKAATGEVRRNDFYKCNIRRIVWPGQPTDQVASPDAQPETDTAITVDVNVMDWNLPVMDNYDLVP